MSPLWKNKRLLLCLVVFANVVFATVSAWSVQGSRRQREAAAETLSRNIAAAVEQSVSDSIAKIDLALLSVMDDLELTGSPGKIVDTGTDDSIADQVRRVPEITAIMVVDRDGVVVAGNGGGAKDGTRVDDRDYFRYLRDNDDRSLRVTKPITGKITGQPVMVLARRLNFPDGTFGGVVFATVMVERHMMILSKFDMGRRGTVIMRDHDLGLISRFPPIPSSKAGQIGDNSVSRELRDAFRPGVNAVTYRAASPSDGVPRVFTARRVARAPVSVIVGVSDEDYLDGWDSEVRKTLSLGFLFILLSAFSVAIVRRLP